MATVPLKDETLLEQPGWRDGCLDLLAGRFGVRCMEEHAAALAGSARLRDVPS